MTPLTRPLYWEGCAKLPWGLNPSQVEEFRGHLLRHNVYQGHVKSQGDGIPRGFAASRIYETVSHNMEDVLTAPHFLPFALQPHIWDEVEAYLGEQPKLYSFNGFWTRPGTAPDDPNIQRWHRDRDDRKFIALFMYGTDILSEADGPHLFAKTSHRRNDGQHREPNGTERVERIFGRAGTCFMADTSGLHYGVKPQRGERLLCWARWGISDRPQSYDWDALKPVPASKLKLGEYPHRIMAGTRLVIDWDR